MFNYFKKKAIENRVNDELLYEYVIEELEKNIKIKGLWAKAYANSDGDANKIEPLYMQYRVQAIKDILTSIEIAYDEISRQKLFNFIGNGFKDEDQLYLSDKEILEKEYHVTQKEKEFMNKYNCNIESKKVTISNKEIIIQTSNGIKRYIR